MLLFRTGDDPDHVVAAGSVHPVNANPLTITVRTSGATYAKVVNGTDISVSIDPLDRIVDDDTWEPLELVGLPVDQPLAGFEYDTSDQGPLDRLMPPVDAAIHRLVRGGPPLGWAPVTEAGRAAPPWQAARPQAARRGGAARPVPRAPGALRPRGPGVPAVRRHQPPRGRPAPAGRPDVLARHHRRHRSVADAHAARPQRPLPQPRLRVRRELHDGTDGRPAGAGRSLRLPRHREVLPPRATRARREPSSPPTPRHRTRTSSCRARPD